MRNNQKLMAKRYEAEIRSYGIEWTKEQWKEYRKRIKATIERGEKETSNGRVNGKGGRRCKQFDL